MDRISELLKRLETTPDGVRLNSFRPEILGDCTVGDLRQAISQESVRSEALKDADAGLFAAGRMLGFQMSLEEAAKVCRSVWLAYHERTPSDNQLLHERLLGGLQASSRCEELIRALFPARVAEGERVRCPGCGNEIDPDTCGCGDPREGHGQQEYPFVPMGCDCYRAAPESPAQEQPGEQNEFNCQMEGKPCDRWCGGNPCLAPLPPTGAPMTDLRKRLSHMNNRELADEIERRRGGTDMLNSVLMPQQWQQIIAALRRQLSSDQVLVPREPTEAMLLAVRGFSSTGNAAAIYRAMLAAAEAEVKR